MQEQVNCRFENELENLVKFKVKKWKYIIADYHKQFKVLEELNVVKPRKIKRPQKDDSDDVDAYFDAKVKPIKSKTPQR